MVKAPKEVQRHLTLDEGSITRSVNTDTLVLFRGFNEKESVLTKTTSGNVTIYELPNSTDKTASGFTVIDTKYWSNFIGVLKLGLSKVEVNQNLEGPSTATVTITTPIIKKTNTSANDTLYKDDVLDDIIQYVYDQSEGDKAGTEVTYTDLSTNLKGYGITGWKSFHTRPFGLPTAKYDVQGYQSELAHLQDIETKLLQLKQEKLTLEADLKTTQVERAAVQSQIDILNNTRSQALEGIISIGALSPVEATLSNLQETNKEISTTQQETDALKAEIQTEIRTIQTQKATVDTKILTLQNTKKDKEQAITDATETSQKRQLQIELGQIDSELTAQKAQQTALQKDIDDLTQYLNKEQYRLYYIRKKSKEIGTFPKDYEQRPDVTYYPLLNEDKNQTIFSGMELVRIFMSNRFKYPTTVDTTIVSKLGHEGKTYSAVFTGFIEKAEVSVTPGESVTVIITLIDVLDWLRRTVFMANPILFPPSITGAIISPEQIAAGKPESDAIRPFTTQLAGMYLDDIMEALITGRGTSEITAEMRAVKSDKLLTAKVGGIGTFVLSQSIPNFTWNITAAQIALSGPDLSDMKYGQDLSAFLPIQHEQLFGPVQWARWIPFRTQIKTQWLDFVAENKTRYDICRQIADDADRLFYSDVWGTIWCHPPLYNEDPFYDRFLIEDAEVLNLHTEKDASKVVTRVYVTGEPELVDTSQVIFMNRNWVDAYSLAGRFGVIERQFNVPYFGFREGELSRKLLAIGRLNRLNAEYNSGSVTILCRPELRVGMPIALIRNIGLDKFFLHTNADVNSSQIVHWMDRHRDVSAYADKLVNNDGSSVSIAGDLDYGDVYKLPINKQGNIDSSEGESKERPLKGLSYGASVYYTTGITHTWTPGTISQSTLTLKYGRIWGQNFGELGYNIPQTFLETGVTMDVNKLNFTPTSNTSDVTPYEPLFISPFVKPAIVVRPFYWKRNGEPITYTVYQNKVCDLTKKSSTGEFENMRQKYISQKNSEIERLKVGTSNEWAGVKVKVDMKGNAAAWTEEEIWQHNPGVNINTFFERLFKGFSITSQETLTQKAATQQDKIREYIALGSIHPITTDDYKLELCAFKAYVPSKNSVCYAVSEKYSGQRIEVTPTGSWMLFNTVLNNQYNTLQQAGAPYQLFILYHNISEINEVVSGQLKDISNNRGLIYNTPAYKRQNSLAFWPAPSSDNFVTVAIFRINDVKSLFSGTIDLAHPSKSRLDWIDPETIVNLGRVE